MNIITPEKLEAWFIWVSQLKEYAWKQRQSEPNEQFQEVWMDVVRHLMMDINDVAKKYRALLESDA